MSAHRRTRRSGLLAALAVLLSPGLAGLQDQTRLPLIVGSLVDDDSGSVIRGGVVELLDEDLSVLASVLTQKDGAFRLVPPGAGTYRLRGEAMGYRTSDSDPLHLAPDDSVHVELRLATDAVVLEPLTVVTAGTPAEGAGLVGMDRFFERHARYSGSPYAAFMLRDSLALWQGRVQSTGHMLRWTTRLVRHVDPVTRAITLQGGCVPTYYLNGSRVPFAMVETLSPDLLQAVEVYLRPAIPAELGRGAPCGVVSYWSRQSPPEPAPENPILRHLAGLTIAIAILLNLARVSIW